MCERELSDIDAISIVGFEREYLDGLLEVAAYRKSGQHLFVLFLGSTIGNFDRPAGVKFLGAVRSILQSGDSLLLGADLEKSIANWARTLICCTSHISRKSTPWHAASKCTCSRNECRS
jgi:uncharacterized SAM-dependent methyltransferase